MQLVEARHRIAGLFFAGQNFSVNCLKIHVVDFGGENFRGFAVTQFATPIIYIIVFNLYYAAYFRYHELILC